MAERSQPVWHRAYISLGSNMGEREDYLARALRSLSGPQVRVSRLSSLYESEPVGYTDQDWFVNQVAGLETTLAPLELLRLLQRVELDLGRKRLIRWGPRVIDLDILLYDRVIMETEELFLPHPRLYQRNFVLIPLQEIASELVHPDGKTTAEHLQKYLATSPKEGIRLLSGDRRN
jgi:2-amino-4-hydroxy-6-hydroxymethyldihydropteridine diphosphokinase